MHTPQIHTQTHTQTHIPFARDIFKKLFFELVRSGRVSLAHLVLLFLPSLELVLVLVPSLPPPLDMIPMKVLKS